MAGLGIGLVTLLIIVALCLAHVALCIVALVLLARAPSERVTMPKWLWALIIIFGHTLGPIAFLMAGRQRDDHWAPMPPDRNYPASYPYQR